MPLTNLLALASLSPILQRLTSRLQAGEPRLVVSGLAGSALPLLIALCHRTTDRPTLAVVEDPEAAEQVKDDLASLLGDEAVYPFPDWEVLPYEHQSPDSEVVGLRLRALDALHRRRPVVVVAPVRALAQKTIPPSLLAGVSLSLRVGDTLSFHAFQSRLVRLGFERTEIVQAPGFFSVRGGIIDLFPFGVERPFRLELFGDDVESIREFDVYTQRSTSTLDRVDILPNREVVIDPATLQDAALRALIAAERAGLDGAELEARILTGGLFEGVERYLPFYHPDAASVLAYLPLDGLICLCEPSRLREQADAYAHEVEEGYAKAAASGEVVPEPSEAFESFGAFLSRLSAYQVAHLTRTSGDSGLPITDGTMVDNGSQPPELNPKSKIQNPKFSSPPEVCDVAAVPTGSFHGALDVLQKRLAEWRGQHAAILVVCDNTGQADRLTELLGPEGDGLGMVVGNLHAGFIIPDLPLVVLTDAEVFSRYRRRQRRRPFKEGILIEDFTSLTEGDYVVHIDHGIGRYLGLQRLVVDERERDCLMIAYADDDRLYIPIEQLHRVQKYIGADGEIPSLSRLGGKAWEQIKARTKKAVQDMAQELIALYAARQARPGFGFSPDTHWQRELEDSFIYEETPDQLKATEEIKQDMERAAPMDRLVCGDVGYGKTEVAIRAAFKAVMDGKQVAVLVPTTILAQQHLTTFSERLADYPVSVQMLSRFKTPQEQKQIIDGLASGAVDIVIGTHRLIQRDVTLKDLGLVIIDEEQRFGVAHKERLKRLKQTVDVLTMTATPIPRTLHMSLVGARDMSIINTPPKDRLPVHTEIVRFDEEVIREAILREVDRGGQVFFVHNRVQSIDSMVHFLQRLLPQVS
ncbi:MAG: DEAD/DEAH box helicase, partial [Candidatus Latescibacteria bacterium]|nr:DEAD/DEAH box helicase [Candidatus Latescibacterota bacterium]